MAKNKMDDLRDHMFAQLERLGEEKIDDKTLEKEIKRAGAIVDLARELTSSAMAEVNYVKATRQITQSNLFKASGAPALEGPKG